MKWGKKGIIAVMLALLVTTVTIYFLFFFSKKTIDPWSLIPDNAALILEIEQPKVFYESIATKNAFWKSLLSVKEIEDLNRILGNLDSVSAQNFPLLNELFNSPFLFSMHPRNDSLKFSYLISIPNNELSETTNLNILAGHLLNNSFEIVATPELEKAVFIRRTGAENGAFVVVKDGILLISSDYLILENISKQSKNDNLHFSNSSQFQKLKLTAGKNVDAHLFINYHFLYSISSSFLNKKSMTTLDWMDNFAGWSVMDLLVKNNELLFSGFTDVSHSNQFLANFSNDAPLINHVYSMLPSNTTFLLNYGTEDFIKNKEPEIVAELSKKTKVNIEAFLASLGNEISLASSATNQQMLEENTWIIAKLKNKENAIKYLEQLNKNSQSTDIEKYKAFEYKRIAFDSILSQLFNFPFQPITKNWYTVLDDYVVFANSPTVLTNYISSIEIGKTLDLNENFTDFSNKFSSYSNLTLLIKPNALNAFSDYFLDKSLTQNDGFLKTLLSSINMLSFQFSASEPFFYTSFSINHSNNFKEEKPYLWKSQMGSEISSKPFLLKNSKKNILLDELLTMYCIDNNGNLIWQKLLDSPVLGNIQEITNKKNKAVQLLFNTKDNIYLLNDDGENASGFPIPIEPAATNEHTLYGNSNEYRLVIAQSDKKIHNYTIEGKQVKGWNLPKMVNIVTRQITHLNSKNKDFLVVIDTDGNVQIVNKFGSAIKIKKPIDQAVFSNFYENKTNGKGEIITTNKKGKLTYISEKGKLQYTDFGNFSPKHYFFYEDFNGDKVIDFIFIDGNKLTVFDRFKKTLFSFTFNSEIDTKPVFYRIDDKQIILAVVAEKENSIYFFNNKGETTIFSEFPENAFFELSFENKNEMNLVVGSSNSIYFYRLK